MERIICIAIGYILGLIQTAYLYGRCNGIDIREHGSGNAGTTNALRVLGKKAGLIVFLGDALKCMAAVFIVYFIFKDSKSDMIYLLKLYAAMGAILGHNFPFYLKFKGGKGIAATAGLIFALHPYFIPMGFIVFCGVFFISHYVSAGSLAVYAAFMIELVVLGQLGVFGMSQIYLMELYLIGAFLTIMAYWKHRENIKRLLHGEERKTYLIKSNKE